MMNVSGNNFPRDTIDQAEAICNSWQELLSKLNVPNISIEAFKEKIAAAKAKFEATERFRTERAQLVKARNTSIYKLWGLTKRVRNAAKATFGDNAPEMTKFGGKPTRERKHKKKGDDPFLDDQS